MTRLLEPFNYKLHCNSDRISMYVVFMYLTCRLQKSLILHTTKRQRKNNVFVLFFQSTLIISILRMRKDPGRIENIPFCAIDMCFPFSNKFVLSLSPVGQDIDTSPGFASSHRLYIKAEPIEPLYFAIYNTDSESLWRALPLACFLIGIVLVIS